MEFAAGTLDGADPTPPPVDDGAAEAVELALEALHRALHHADAQARSAARVRLRLPGSASFCTARP
jgi:hypothetical protein